MTDRDEEDRPIQTGPLDYHEAIAESEPRRVVDMIGTSGQLGARRATVSAAHSDDLATIEDDEDIVTPLEPMRLDHSAESED